jgi:hypothetical protein
VSLVSTKVKRTPVIGQYLVEQAERAAVEVVAADDALARRNQAQQRVDGGHARGEGQAVAAALQRRQASVCSAVRVGLSVRA